MFSIYIRIHFFSTFFYYLLFILILFIFCFLSFRYSRIFSTEGSRGWPVELTTPPPTFPIVSRPTGVSVFVLCIFLFVFSSFFTLFFFLKKLCIFPYFKFVNVGAIDDVRKWLVERGTINAIVALLKNHQDDSEAQLLERATATLANIALYSPSIPYLLRQTVIGSDDSGVAGATQEELVHLREEEEVLLLEEIRLRENITSREKNVVRFEEKNCDLDFLETLGGGKLTKSNGS